MNAEPMDTRDRSLIRLDDEAGRPRSADPDPGLVPLTCANSGAALDERMCKLVRTCGSFLSCSDYC